MIVYKISGPAGSYIGTTKRKLKTRMTEHLSCSKKNKNKLSIAINKYGKERFLSEIITTIPDSHRFRYENFFINHYDSFHNGYNSSFASTGPIGRNMSDGHKTIVGKASKKTVACFNVMSKQGDILMTTNDYDEAARLTSQSRDSVRKKVRNNRPCAKYNYELLAGGDLSQ